MFTKCGREWATALEVRSVIETDICAVLKEQIDWNIKL